jgi:putative methionine-R-sulfoxide reductase with GAF domain
MNADASLDLSQIAARYTPVLRSTVSVPILRGAQLVGVFTAYASRVNAFQDSDRYVFEQVVDDFHNQLSQFPKTSAVVAFPRQRR